MKTKKTKENPITFFRKANEARQGVVKKSLTKAQKGVSVKEKNPERLIKEKGGNDPAVGSVAYRKLFNSKQAMDSANYYRNVSKNLALSNSKDSESITKNLNNLQRQYDKGKPGYDKNGFPIKKTTTKKKG